MPLALPRQNVSASTGPIDALLLKTSAAMLQAQAAMNRLQKNRNLGRFTASAMTPANKANRKMGT